MTTTSLLTDYTDALRSEPDRWLGLVVLYSVADTVVQHDDLVQLLEGNGLSKYVPTRPADADVFRRTCTAAQRKRQATSDPDVYANVLTRDVASDDEEIVKRLVVETVDASNRRLDYSPAYDLVFSKVTSLIDVRRIGSGVDPIADEVAMEIARKYDKLKGTVDGACIRTVIGRVLDGCKATSLRQGGGSYFVARDDAETVAGLERFADAVEGTTVHAIPLPDDHKQRAKVLTAVEEEAKVEVERLQGELADALRDGKQPSGAATATFIRKYTAIVEKADLYAGLLDATLSSVRGGIRLLDMQMEQLTGVRRAA